MLVGSGFRVLGSRISEDLVSTMLIVVGLGIKAAVSVSRVLLPRDFRYTQLRWVSTTLLEQRGCYPGPSSRKAFNSRCSHRTVDRYVVAPV